MVVLDASALLAVLHKEPGADLVIRHMRGAHVSVVNICEVLTKAAEHGADAVVTLDILNSYGFRTRAFRDADAVAAAMLRPATKHLGLSLGDRACLVLAKFEALPILTSDTQMARAELGIDVRLIR